MRAGSRLLLLPLLLSCSPHGSARILLQQGRPGEVLERVRPVDAPGIRLRACALWRMGQPQRARHELLVGLALDERSAASHLMLGTLELHTGHEGAALKHLQRSLALDPSQPEVRAEVSRLLLSRAALRLDPAPGILQPAQAHEDARLAAAITPSFAGEACRLRAEGQRRKRQLARPDGRVRMLKRSGRGPQRCPGVPPDLDPDRRPLPPSGCGLRHTGRFLTELRRSYLLVSCFGAQVAFRLEEHGCLGAAFEIWEAMRQEGPGDPRWPLQMARNLLAQDKPQRAEMYFLRHAFLSGDRAAALLQSARLLLLAGKVRHAARRAVDSMVFPRGRAQQLQAIEILRRCGMEQKADLALRQLGGMRARSP